MDSRLDQRYLHIAGAFAVGGRLTRIGGVPVDLPIETVAPAHLPMVGRRSASSAKGVLVDGREVKFGRIDPKQIKALKKKKLLSVGWARSLAESDPAGPNGPFVSRTVSEVKNLEIADGFFLKSCALSMLSTHNPADPFPRVTFGRTEINGLKLGKSKLTVTLDLETFNRLATQAEFVAEFKKNSQQAPFSSFLTDPVTGELHRNQSGYIMGSLVKKIEGQLPPGAKLEDNGYIIDWPEFGKIILGEILIGPYVRRVTLVRLKHSDAEAGSGCSGGSTWP
jgi:hypothetical protein